MNGSLLKLVELPGEVIVAFEMALGLIFLDLMLGIIRALSKGEFEPRKLPKFLQSSVLPYVGSLALLAIFSTIIPEIKALYFTAVTAVNAKFLFDVKDKIFSLIGKQGGKGKTGETGETGETADKR
ncbi:hypothetical protein JCM15765_14250 [Paradesulfitobacterium aromaticivorans]